MSKVVPMDQPLSDESRAYLRTTGAVGQAREAQLDQIFPPDPDALAAFNERERAFYAKIHDTSGTADRLADALDENEVLRRRIAELEAGPPPNVPTDYSKWLKPQLEAEVDRVNGEDPEAGLEKGKVADMAKALTAYFADSDEDAS